MVEVADNETLGVGFVGEDADALAAGAGGCVEGAGGMSVGAWWWMNEVREGRSSGGEGKGKRRRKGWRRELLGVVDANVGRTVACVDEAVVLRG